MSERPDDPSAERPAEQPVDIELDIVAHHQPDREARDAAAADDAARRADYSDNALETLRMATAADDEITEEQRAVRDKTARSMMLVGMRTVIVRGLGLVGTIFLARLLSKEDYGVVALGLTIIVLGRFLADGGLGPGLIRREQPPARYEYAALLAFQQAITWPVAAVGSLLAFTTLSVGGNEGALTMSLMFVGMAIDVMRSANSIACERDLEYRPVVRAEIVEFLVYNVLAIGLVAGGMGLVGVGIANVARAVTGSGLLILTGPVGWIWPKWNGGVVRGLAKFGAYFQASWLATMFRDQGLAMILFAISGRGALGAFDQARRLLVIVTLFFESAWRVGLPGLARMMEAGAEPKMLLERGLGLAGVAMALPVVGLVSTCEWLVPLLLGDGWTETADLIPWVGAAIMITIPMATIISTLLWAQDEPKKVFVMGLPALVVTLGVGAVAMTRYEAVGAGIGLVAGGVVFVVSAAGMARDVFGPTAIPRFAGPVLAAAGASFAGWSVAYELDPSPFVGTFVSGLVGMGALVVLLLLVARNSTLDLWRFVGKARS
ncbi:MAG: oligosaccharide flippase family protein [Solirubrobacteraceae bacterium]|nr:oligosaccharide flippase family protein [Solirubrobacteraceae bacterium]